MSKDSRTPDSQKAPKPDAKGSPRTVPKSGKVFGIDISDESIELDDEPAVQDMNDSRPAKSLNQYFLDRMKSRKQTHTDQQSGQSQASSVEEGSRPTETDVTENQENGSVKGIPPEPRAHPQTTANKSKVSPTSDTIKTKTDPRASTKSEEEEISADTTKVEPQTTTTKMGNPPKTTVGTTEGERPQVSTKIKPHTPTDKAISQPGTSTDASTVQPHTPTDKANYQPETSTDATTVQPQTLTDKAKYQLETSTNATTVHPHTPTDKVKSQPETSTHATTVQPQTPTDKAKSQPETSTDATTGQPQTPTDKVTSHPGVSTDATPVQPQTYTEKKENQLQAAINTANDVPRRSTLKEKVRFQTNTENIETPPQTPTDKADKQPETSTNTSKIQPQRRLDKAEDQPQTSTSKTDSLPGTSSIKHIQSHTEIHSQAAINTSKNRPQRSSDKAKIQREASSGSDKLSSVPLTDGEAKPVNQPPITAMYQEDEDEPNAKWVEPCNCKGTTRWVHHSCLQMWVDEKLKEHQSRNVACPQCKTEYLIFIPKANFIVWTLDKLDTLIYRICPFVTAGVVIGSLYWNAVTFGALVVAQTAGMEEVSALMSKLNTSVVLAGLPLIPLSLIVFRLFHWEDSVLHFLRTTSRCVPPLQYILPNHIASEAGILAEMQFNSSMNLSRILAGAFILPTVARACGELFFKSVPNRVHRVFLGGAVFVGVKGLLKMYHKQQIYKKFSQRKILDHTEENHRLMATNRQVSSHDGHVAVPTHMRSQFHATISFP